MLRKILVAVGWVAGIVAAICVLLYLAILLVNWRDVEPSESALRMADFHRNRPAVRDQDNAYVYAMGFDVAPAESPLETGRKRVEWLRSSEGQAPLDQTEDPLDEPRDHRAASHPLILAYYEACGPRGPDCRAASESAAVEFDRWMASEGWLFERYRTLLTLDTWREYVSVDSAATLPSYAPIMDGQKLLLLHASVRAAQGDASGVRELLDEDLRFWRAALESSDLLVTKMIATAALLRHFKSGAFIIRTLPPESARKATPEEWHVEITDRERSLQRCLNSEWIIWSGVIRNLDQDLSGMLSADDSILGRALELVSLHVFQPQDTINRYADYYSSIVELLDGVALPDLDAAANRVTELSEKVSREAFPPRTLYNITGRILLGFGPDFGAYARRVGDIEGVRRAALVSVELHETKITLDAISAALEASALRNPYDGEPFAWDATDNAVVFNGLEPGERGKHRIH